MAVLAKKPFAVIDATPVGLDAFEAAIASAHVPVNGYAGTVAKSLQQAPYRWGQSDAQASAINTAEFAGKQLVGGTAQWAGDTALQKQKRVFGTIYADATIDVDGFSAQLAKYKGKVVESLPYTSNGSTLGDSVSAQQAAPTIVTKLKSSGVTTVFLFTDVAMTTAVLQQATQQEFRPEWVITAYQYQDLSILSRNYDRDQWAHAFGISNLYPYVASAGGQNSSTDPFAWFWGANNGTYSVQGASWIGWVMAGIHAAGPNLTPKTFQQGLFALPAVRRRRVVEPGIVPDRVRQDRGTAVRRVHGARHRLRAGVVRCEHRELLADPRHEGHRHHLVPRRREALPRGPVAHEAARVLRRVSVDQPVRHAAGAADRAGAVRELPEHRQHPASGRGVNPLQTSVSANPIGEPCTAS